MSDVPAAGRGSKAPGGLRRVALVDGCRTPFQHVATGFVDSLSYQLAGATLRGLLERNALPAEALGRVIYGAIVSNPRTTNVAREAALTSGVPATVPAVTLTAAGASATAAIAHGADLIATGQCEAVIAGGTDCLSDPPIGLRRSMRTKMLKARRMRTAADRLRFVLGLRPRDFLPDIPTITEFTTGQTMGGYTEGLAERLGISRADQDAYAVVSHRRAHAARHRLAAEIVPVDTPGGEVREDNGVRADTTPERLGRLRPSFSSSGTLTAGNSSFLTDGAAAVLLMSEEAAQAHGLKPKAFLRSQHLAACDPQGDLLLGPLFATPEALRRAALDLQSIDVFEIHEAFAAQILAVLRLFASDDFARENLGLERALGSIPEDRLNAWGGSLALGNPFAPNGARLVTTAMSRLHAEEGRHALVATCAGGGLGHAMVLEKSPTD